MSKSNKRVYMGLPVESIISNATKYGHETDGWLLDGQQRVTTVDNYVHDRLRVRGYLYSDLPKVERSHFARMHVSFIETSVWDPGHCQDLYDRLVYGGTSHPAKNG